MEVYSTCWKTMKMEITQSDADEECRKLNGATLVAIESDVENSELIRYVSTQLFETFWIGLYCTTNNVDDCIWIHGRGHVDDPNRFPNDEPDVRAGNCVVFNVRDGSWSSQDCNEKFQFVCELPSTTTDDCPNNYNHHCYTIYPTALQFTKAQETCQENCGNLVSIHSELENRYICSIFDTSDIILLGGMAPDSSMVLWADDSIQVYNNIERHDEGFFVFMNLATGQWFSGYNNYAYSSFVCKRQSGLKC